MHRGDASHQSHMRRAKAHPDVPPRSSRSQARGAAAQLQLWQVPVQRRRVGRDLRHRSQQAWRAPARAPAHGHGNLAAGPATVAAAARAQSAVPTAARRAGRFRRERRRRRRTVLLLKAADAGPGVGARPRCRQRRQRRGV
eukprot:334992-Chlamydomonas_euryale.AAC.1